MPHNGRLSYTRAKITLQEWTDRSIHVLYQGKELPLMELAQQPKRLLQHPRKFNLGDFLRQEVQSKVELHPVT